MTSVPSKAALTGQIPRDCSIVDVPIARGQLVPLRTKAELQARDETVEVHVVEVPLKDTGKVLGIVKAIPGQNTIDLHHLRRVVKHGYEPASLFRAKAALAVQTRARPVTQATASGTDENSSDHEGVRHCSSETVAPAPADRTLESSDESRNPAPATEIVHILLAPTSLINPSDLLGRLHTALPFLFPKAASTSTSPLLPFQGPPSTSQLITLSAPLHPPPTPHHATTQSSALWPTVYNPNTVYGPNPAIVAAAQADIEPSAGAHLGLAKHIGRVASKSGRGEAVGVVVIERTNREGHEHDEAEKIVAVAGDGRYAAQPNTDLGVTGTGSTQDHAGEAGARIRRPANPANHAVMRAIEVVASKRREQLASQCALDPSSAPDTDIINTNASSSSNASTKDELTVLEDRYNNPLTNLKPHGYLCLNLEFYISHEPCLMCSMALVHSRVGRVVFGRRMPGTGGLCAETLASGGGDGGDGDWGGEVVGHGRQSGRPGLGYGLFWREELNWRFLCWEWMDDDTEIAEEDNELALNGGIHA